MATPQSGITLTHRKSGIFIEINQVNSADIGEAIRHIHHRFQQIQSNFPQEELGLTVAFGHDLWRALAGKDSAPELKNFTGFGRPEREFAPAT